MIQARPKKRGAAPAHDFLLVDDFLRDLVPARALKSALELRLVDYLLEHAPQSAEAIAQALRLDAAGLAFLLQLLLASQVVDRVDGRYRLHARFVKALAFRDLLEAKLDFAGFVAPDLLEQFTSLIADPAGFKGRSRLYDLFDYRRCLEPTHENYERTRAWMRLTSTLTRYEARALLSRHDFGAARRLLDVGGNSGELALQLCRAHPALQATVMDLPLVVEIAQEHVLPHAERERIAFLAGDLRRDALPAGQDLVCFKSMLHDWPEAEARRFIAAGAQALDPGGTLLIFERAPLDPAARPPGFGSLPVLLFFRSYRDPALYRDALQAAGLRDIRLQTVELDVPFVLLTATKPGVAREPLQSRHA